MSNNNTTNNNIEIIDTFLIEDQKIFLFNEHIERTLAACAAHNFNFWTRENLSKIYEQILQQADLQSEKQKARICLRQKKFRSTIEEIDTTYPSPITVVATKSPFFKKQEWKTNNRSHWNEMQKIINQNYGSHIFDYIVINPQNHLVESSRFNLFYEDDQQFYTPPTSDGGLKGTFQAAWVKSGQCPDPRITKKISERSLPLSEINNYKIYLGNSVRGLIAIDQIIIDQPNTQ